MSTTPSGATPASSGAGNWPTAEHTTVDVRIPLALLNAPVFTTLGAYRVSALTAEQAVALAGTFPDLVSAIGHAGTAEWLSNVIGRTVPVSRQCLRQQVGQLAIAVELSYRPPEGVILSRDDIERVGAHLRMIERLS